MPTNLGPNLAASEVENYGSNTFFSDKWLKLKPIKEEKKDDD